MIYVLIIVTHVYGGSAVSFQEFGAKPECEAALAWVKENARMVDGATCLPKGATMVLP